LGRIWIEKKMKADCTRLVLWHEKVLVAVLRTPAKCRSLIKTGVLGLKKYPASHFIWLDEGKPYSTFLCVEDEI